MIELRPYQPGDGPRLARLWNGIFAGGPNFVTVAEQDLARRVTGQPSFDPNHFLLAIRAGGPVGFVHFGFRTSLWTDLAHRRVDLAEGQIYQLAAPAGDRALAGELLEAAVARLAETGARRVLLGPSWIWGTQPFYNGIAGAYELAGLSTTRRELLDLADEHAFASLARYGTPELDLTDSGRLDALAAEGKRLWERAREWRLRRRTRRLRPGFFSERTMVCLVRGAETVAMAACGPWEEYARQYGRRLFGITSVQVAESWRGRGLGKLIMILAMEEALRAGAEGIHLHVYRGNRPAWNLYHRALGFQLKWEWVTLARDLT